MKGYGFMKEGLSSVFEKVQNSALDMILKMGGEYKPKRRAQHMARAFKTAYAIADGTDEQNLRKAIKTVMDNNINCFYFGYKDHGTFTVDDVMEMAKSLPEEEKIKLNDLREKIQEVTRTDWEMEYHGEQPAVVAT